MTEYKLVSGAIYAGPSESHTSFDIPDDAIELEVTYEETASAATSAKANIRYLIPVEDDQ